MTATNIEHANDQVTEKDNDSTHKAVARMSNETFSLASVFLKPLIEVQSLAVLLDKLTSLHQLMNILNKCNILTILNCSTDIPSVDLASEVEGLKYTTYKPGFQICVLMLTSHLSSPSASKSWEPHRYPQFTRFHFQYRDFQNLALWIQWPQSWQDHNFFFDRTHSKSHVAYICMKLSRQSLVTL